MRHTYAALMLLLSGCAHTSQDAARLKALEDSTQAMAAKQEELARRVEALAVQQDLIASDVKGMTASLASLDDTLDGLKKERPAPPRPSGPDPEAVYKVVVGDGAVRGPAGAKITIIEYADFQCPFCSRAAATLKEIERAYPNEIRLVYKHLPLPFHQNAMRAAKAAEAAGLQGKFWPMWDLLFENNSDLSEEKVDELAGKLQLNMKKFREAMASDAIADKVNRQAKEADRVGAHGTPSFFVNGRSVVGAQPFDSFKVVIDEEMRRADKLLGSGVKREQLYDKLVADGKSSL